MTKKLRLKTFIENDEKITSCLFEHTIWSTFVDMVWCDVVPMDSGDILLGKPVNGRQEWDSWARIYIHVYSRWKALYTPSEEAGTTKERIKDTYYKRRASSMLCLQEATLSKTWVRGWNSFKSLGRMMRRCNKTHGPCVGPKKVWWLFGFLICFLFYFPLMCYNYG